MRTNEETINTGISIDTVNESKWKPHNIITNNRVVEDEIINFDPLTPSFLPKNPEDIEESKGEILSLKDVILFLYSIAILPLNI